MDQITRAWYGKDIELQLHKRKEQAYEDLFCDLMEKKYSDNFQLVKAAGRDGDGKSDGYLIPEKCIYQVYAPSSGFQKNKLLTKIKGDFEGAKSKWGPKMAKWTFVHNEWEGLPKYALDCLDDIRANNAGIEVSSWRPAILKDLALDMAVKDLVDLFGPAPTQSDVVSLTHDPIKTLLRAISGKETGKAVLAPVSVDKLQYNRLSEDVETLLTAGRTKEKLVEDLLMIWPDPEYGEELAESFRRKYHSLKEEGVPPDEIFSGLQAFAGGNSDVVSAQVSSLAVLSYFFERCDIFDNAPIGWTQ